MNLKHAFLLQLCDPYPLSTFLDVVEKFVGLTLPRFCYPFFNSFNDSVDYVLAVLTLHLTQGKIQIQLHEFNASLPITVM
jgi:hypothetical protein